MEIMDREWIDLIAEGARALKVSIDESAILRFRDHALHLLTWNQKINLTTIIQPEEMALKHYVDSVAPLFYMPPSCRVIDIGSGGGFPGIPLKIACPALSLTLVDSSLKKVNFLKDAIRALSLTEISAHHIRAEDIVHDPLIGEGFDVAVMRAFSSLDACVRKALPLLKADGMILAMKGREVSAEVETVMASIYKDRAGKKREGRTLDIQVFSYPLPRTGDGRSMVIVRNSSEAVPFR